jgi:hypothetical protein
VNLAEAHAELSRPLVFGDERQRLAKRFLEDVNHAHQRLLNCPRCKGDGVLTAKRPFSSVQCECIRRYPREVIEACGITWFDADEEKIAKRRRAQIGRIALIGAWIWWEGWRGFVHQ